MIKLSMLKGFFVTWVVTGLVLVFFSSSVSGTVVTESNTIPVNLTVDAKPDPVGIQTMSPTFGWKIKTGEKGYRQSAWQLLVASTQAELDKDVAGIWDSGKRLSNEQQFIPYKGAALSSGRKYYWKVRIWDDKGIPSDWSSPAFFITGLFAPHDWDHCDWIALEELDNRLKVVPGVHLKGDNLGEKAIKRAVIPLFRKSFLVTKKIKEAYLFITGLGQYEASLNGGRIGDAFLSPGWTNYEKQVLYNVYDVSGGIKSGENVLGAIVAPGFRYINRERYRKLVRAEGYPMLRAKLSIRYTDGTSNEIRTDSSWQTSASPITFSSIYGGEDYDAQLEQPDWDKPGFSAKLWQNVILVKGPNGLMTSEMDYPMKVMDTFAPQNKTKVTDTSYLYDFGQNASGIIRLGITGNKGDRIRIIPAEVLGDDGMPNQDASGKPYYYEYILRGSGEETWQPRFSYYGFRYALVQVSASAGFQWHNINLTALHTRNSSPAVGTFLCSNPLINQIDTLIRWGIRSNLASVSTDCPHREKLGWLEQTHLIGSSLKYNHDILHLYNKVVDDMIAGQLDNGLVPDIVPEYVPFQGGFRDSPEWGSAAILVPWYTYQWYGDKQIVERAFPMMERYISYLATKAKGDTLAYGLGDWFDLGPKNPGVSQLTPLGVTATAMYYYDASLLAEMATLLGDAKKVQQYRQLAERIKTAFNNQYFNEKTGVYASGSQTSYAMPLFTGMVPQAQRKRVQKNLIESIYRGNKALTAGDIGYRYLLRALEDAGASQLIYEMNNRDDVPGYGYQIKHGATALTESWAALKYVSNNHMMLGHFMEWLYSGLGGIKQLPGDAGFKKILIEPQEVDGINWVNVSYESINGNIQVRWKRENGRISYTVSIPPNTCAKVIIPVKTANAATALKKNMATVPTAGKVTIDGKKAMFDLGSGTYTF
ncbi:Alpha-L-rhamnosidase N-terminal domain-containing protein [bacterium A37T11]|nr:Alpha-L-rhamnosidase N-terminal domain-containing protein [bacterium A37T11]